MPNKYLNTVVLVIFILIVANVYALPPTPKPPTAPIDSGVIGLIIVAVGYAVKKIKDNSKL